MMNKENFPKRQVHLDFHTSPDIENIGKNFSKENFQAALKEGNLESITIFAKCHHSMCFYPTKVGTMHPHLDFDLTGAMIDAAHEVGVRAPIYITAGWSHEDAEKHPEWRMVQKDGTELTMKEFDPSATDDTPKPHCHWRMLCINDGGEYAQHIYDITEEVCQRYEVVDGLFYDICGFGEACYCESCIKGMKEMGLDPSNDEDAKKYYIIKRSAFMQKCNDILKKYHPDATVFYNGNGAHQYKTYAHDYQTHFEMEDLPTAWGGYDKLPMRAKYFGKKDKGIIGMTGKFHLEWGEFGGFKSGDALKFETALMALYGAGASIGDHMHPDGMMEMQTYKNIGKAYKYLEQIAPFCYGGNPISDIGIYASDVVDANEGVSNILLQNQLDYDVVTDNDFGRFKTVIIPGKATFEKETLSALEEYVKDGGNLVLMADALVEDGKFLLDLGFEYIGESEFDCDYLVPTVKRENLPDAPMLCNYPGHRVSAPDAKVSAEFITPYFSRTYAHFCGHKNTPHDKNSKPYPAIAAKGNVVYIAHPLGEEYLEYGSPYHKNYFMLALDMVHTDRVLSVKGLGAQGRCTVIEQADKNRYCLNIAYASPIRRGVAEIIEDIMPVYNIGVELKTEKKIKKVYVGLTGEKLKFTQKGGKVNFVLPELDCHTSVVIEYK